MTEIREDPAWYCLRSKTKREHIAAAFVVQQCEIEVFAPRIPVWRKLQTGRKVFIEALFPGYFFARFAWGDFGRRILATQGVTGVVRFGNNVPVIRDSIVVDLQRATAEVTSTDSGRGALDEGDIVEILEGCFKGTTGTVGRAPSGRNRVSVLIDFLGRSLMVSVERSSLLACGPEPIIVPDPLLRSGRD